MWLLYKSCRSWEVILFLHPFFQITSRTIQHLGWPRATLIFSHTTDFGFHKNEKNLSGWNTAQWKIWNSNDLLRHAGDQEIHLGGTQVAVWTGASFQLAIFDAGLRERKDQHAQTQRNRWKISCDKFHSNCWAAGRSVFRSPFPNLINIYNT